MMSFRHIRALVLVASALVLASRAALPVHMLLPGADGVVYVALCTATGIKQVPLRKGGSGQEQSGGVQGCAHSLCAASLHVSSAARLTEGVGQNFQLEDPPASNPVSVVSDFAYARGPPPGRVWSFGFQVPSALSARPFFMAAAPNFSRTLSMARSAAPLRVPEVSMRSAWSQRESGTRSEMAMPINL